MRVSATRGNVCGLPLRGINGGTAFQPVYWEMTGKMPVAQAISPLITHEIAFPRDAGLAMTVFVAGKPMINLHPLFN